MSYIKVPSWLELVKLKWAFSQFDIFKSSNEQLFWKEQSLRFGFDIREALHDVSWQSFFYEKFFKYTLKRIDNNLENLKSWEQNFWKRNGHYVKKLELTPMSTQDIELMMSWFPTLEHLTLKRCNTLLQASVPTFTSLANLHTLEIIDAHLVSEKTFYNIPESTQTIIINSAKSITGEFFEHLALLKQLTSLSLQNCHSLELNHICRLPPKLKELDLSGSGNNIMPDACFYLPRTLETLRMNRWDHFTDTELMLLPTHLHTLELEGWRLTNAGLLHLQKLPLTSLNISRTFNDESIELNLLPKTLKSLNISQNRLLAEDVSRLAESETLEELDASYIPFDDAQIHLPKNLKRLNLSYSGALKKNTIHALKQIKSLKKLSLAACSVENSDLEWLPEHLEELDLSLCTTITDVSLMLLGNLKSLTTLILDGCDQIRGFGLSALSPTVKKLSLAGLHRLSGKSLVQLPQAVEELSLDSCELIMLEDIIPLPTTLQVLSLANVPNIGNDAVDILSSLPLLNTIDLQGCTKITEAAVAKLVRRKFEGTIIITADCVTKHSDIELHPSVSMLRKTANFKARLIYKLKHQPSG